MIASLDLPTLDARAKGLLSRLFTRAELEELAGAASLDALALGLERRGRLLVPIARPATVAAVESAVRHTAARHLRTLSVWAGSGPALDVFYADQDRRSLRALLRATLQGAPHDVRLAGLLPTPRLPERALTSLARQPTPGRLVAELVLLGHPEAARLAPHAGKAQPVLLDLERSLVRAFAEQALHAARSGDQNLRDVVRARIDVCNMQMALTFAAGPNDVTPEALFTEGGGALTRDAFLDACAAESAEEAASRLARRLVRTPLGSVAREAGANTVRLETASLGQAMREQRRRARLDPLGSAPLVVFLLRLQAETADVARIAWGTSLEAPASVVRAGLVSPWT